MMIAWKFLVALAAAAGSAECSNTDLLDQCGSAALINGRCQQLEGGLEQPAALEGGDVNSVLQVSTHLTKRAAAPAQATAAQEASEAKPAVQQEAAAAEEASEAKPAVQQEAAAPRQAAQASASVAEAARANPAVAVAGAAEATPAPKPAALMQATMAMRAEGERAAAASRAAQRELEAAIVASRKENPEVLATAAAGLAGYQVGGTPVSLIQGRREGTQFLGDLLSLSNIITIVAIVIIIFFALVLYHNNFNVQRTVEDIRSNPSGAFQDAKSEARGMYDRNIAGASAAGKGAGRGAAESWGQFSQAAAAQSTAQGFPFDPFNTQAYNDGSRPASQRKTCC